ncbi:COMM domain-containing protein 8 [Cavenderia fasciculata]|uniref:COMM domain-containing protein 8 n=1 Tax=Cavenderia fasciculata TaxID=261658 RepID=F4QBC3_CACFS|nr:COMM domain-containing protein 8 [Cavenderia fasciculata]EGG14895.1 COMM domain-containing protein 8 [Cavenderia fasciculata]|eukprot:XP_004351411.1 COMM domain-containing protein 8 [Cavenderia fasciculata]
MVAKKYNSITEESPLNSVIKVYNELILIEKLKEKEKVSLLIHTCIDRICGNDKQPADDDQPISPTLQSIINNYISFINRVVGKELKKDQILQDLKTAGLNDEIAIVITDCIISRYQDIKRELTEKLSAISSSHLKDFDWKVNLVLASDKMNSVQENVLQLNLSINNQDNQTTNTVNSDQKLQQLLVELTKKDLDQLLATFDDINKVIQSLKVN